LTTNDNIIYFKKAGDGLLICSTSCLFAANIALLLRDRFLSINWKEEDYFGSVIPRIAIHFGLITVHSDGKNKIDDISGNNVICASRIEPITQPGTVYCSDLFYNELTKTPTNNVRGISLGSTKLAKDYGSINIYRLHWENEFLGSTESDDQPGKLI
jgi:class 3 adenylate cyclase